MVQKSVIGGMQNSTTSRTAAADISEDSKPARALILIASITSCDDMALTHGKQGEGMRSAEMLVWMGDFNYRIDLDYGTVVHLVDNFLRGDRGALSTLLEEVRPLALDKARCCIH